MVCRFGTALLEHGEPHNGKVSWCMSSWHDDVLPSAQLGQQVRGRRGHSVQRPLDLLKLLAANPGRNTGVIV